MITEWLSDKYIEIFGALAGIVYVFLEIRQNIWLWPVGIITSAVYIWVFFTGKFYADMSLQGYYLVISITGWYWWQRDTGLSAQSTELSDVSSASPEIKQLSVTHITRKTTIILSIVFILLYAVMCFFLDRLTDSPVPEWDSFITSLSIVATWMLARKIYEHWYLWIIVNFASVVIFTFRGLYPTVVLYSVYGIMSFAGLWEWRKTIRQPLRD
jgi:nicotinamide mononucleotide transporter